MNAKLFDAALDLSQVNLAFYWSKRGELDLYLPGGIVTIFGKQLEATLQFLHLHHIPVEVMA